MGLRLGDLVEELRHGEIVLVPRKRWCWLHGKTHYPNAWRKCRKDNRLKYTIDEALDMNRPQNEFSKARAAIADACVADILQFVPRSKKHEVIGAVNDLSLFLLAAEKAAPDRR